MRKAFTLIELLVVIAIIAILAAILFPVFAQAKMAAKKAVGLADAKQIALAGQMYAADFDDCVVLNGRAADPIMFWADLLQPYIKNWGVFAPPVGNVGEFWRSGTSRVAGGKADVGFTINNAYWYDATHGHVFEQHYQTAAMTSFADTSQCVFAADGGQDGWNYTAGYQVVAVPINAAGVPDLVLGKLASGPLTGRLILGSKAERQGFFLARYNNDSLTTAFFDGHAKTIKMDELAKTNSQGHYVHLSRAELPK